MSQPTGLRARATQEGRTGASAWAFVPRVLQRIEAVAGEVPHRCYKDPQIFPSFQNHTQMPTVGQTLRPNCGPHGGHRVSQEGSKISRADRRSHVQGGEGQSTEYPQAGETSSIEHRLHEVMNCLASARKEKQLRPQQREAAAGAGPSQWVGEPHTSLERLPVASWGKPPGAFNSELWSHLPFRRTAPPAAAWSQAGLPQQAAEPRSWARSSGGRKHAQIQARG